MLVPRQKFLPAHRRDPFRVRAGRPHPELDGVAPAGGAGSEEVDVGGVGDAAGDGAGVEGGADGGGLLVEGADGGDGAVDEGEG